MESTSTTPKVLRLRGEEIRCIDALPPGLLFDLAEMSEQTEVMKTMALIGRFVREIVIPEDQDRLRAVLYDKVNVLDVTELSDVVGDLIREYAGRPTERPSPLPNGSEPTGQVSRVVSFSRGSVETVDPLSPVGPSNDY